MLLGRLENNSGTVFPAGRDTRPVEICERIVDEISWRDFTEIKRTNLPRPKRIDITRAWGNLTLTPYTKPLRAPFSIAR